MEFRPGPRASGHKRRPTRFVWHPHNENTVGHTFFLVHNLNTALVHVQCFGRRGDLLNPSWAVEDKNTVSIYCTVPIERIEVTA